MKAVLLVLAAIMSQEPHLEDRSNNDSNLEAENLLGEAHRLQEDGRSQEAVKLYQRAIPLFESAGNHLKAAELHGLIGDHYLSQNRRRDALDAFKARLSLTRSAVGSGNSLELASSMDAVASCLGSLGRTAEALKMHEEVLKLRKRIFRDDHQDIANSLDNVAFCLHSLGRGEEAVLKGKEALEMRRRIFPGDHEDVASSLHSVAYCLDSLGRRTEALPKFEEAIEMERRIHSSGHPHVAGSLSHTGSCLESLGRSEEALAKFEEALEIYQRIYSGDHPRVASELHRVASCLESLGRCTEALPKSEAALEMHKRIYSGDHPRVAISLYMVACCMESLGRNAEALPKFKEALNMQKRIFPGGHPYVVSCLSGVASCLDSLGRSAEALQIHEEVLEMQRRISPGDHQDLAVGLNNLALCLRNLGRSKEARQKHEEALEMQRRIYPGDHPHVANSMNNLAECLRSLGPSGGALQLHEEVLEMRRRIFPRGHPEVANSLNHVAYCLRSLGRMEEALQRHEEALEMQKRIFPGDHPYVANSMNSAAECLLSLDRSEEALPKFEEALEMRRRVYSGDAPLVVTSMANLAFCLLALGQNEKALQKHEETLEMAKRVFPDNHPNVAIISNNIAYCMRILGRHKEALRWHKDSYSLARATNNSKAHLFAANYGRLLCFEGGQWEEAARVLDFAIEKIEQLRVGTRGLREQDRATLQGHLTRSNPFESMIEVQINLGSVSTGLGFAERSRARSSLDLLNRNSVRPMDRALRHARQAENEELAAHIENVAGNVERYSSEVSRLSHEIGRLAHDEISESVDRDARAQHLESERRTAMKALDKCLRRRAQLVREQIPLANPLSSNEIQATLSDGRCLLYYSIGEAYSHLFLVPPVGQEIRSFELKWKSGERLTKDSLEKLIDGYSTWIEQFARNTLKETEMQPFRGTRSLPDASRVDPRSIVDGGPSGIGHDLYRALVPEEVWEEISSCSLVYIVPNGSLHRLPFDALVAAPSMKHGKETYWLDIGPPIAYVASGSILKWCQERAEDLQSKPPGMRIVALGDAIFSHKSSRAANATKRGASLESSNRIVRLNDPETLYGDLVPLPETRVEVETIRQICRKAAERIDGEIEFEVTTLIGEEATERHLFELAPRADVLHIATHYLPYETDTASYSALALTLPHTPTSEDNGFLELREVLEHWPSRLEDCELVVLSACSTQRGRQQKDEGVWAMPIGFLYAGCPSVLSSLWEVRDKEASMIMAEFYRGFLLGGESKAEALWQAKRALRASGLSSYDWAPWVLIGSP